MGAEWPHKTLKDAGVRLIDCVHKTPADAGEGLPYIAIPQMKAGRIDFNAKPRLISESDFREWTQKANPQESDVVLSRRCNPGETAYVPQGVRFALGQNLVLLRSDESCVYPPFLRWLTKGPQWWNQISKFLNVGAIFDSLKCADVPNFELTIPPLEDQKSIAHILGSLDDKIELNRQMNATLEAMAQALFKSWFVDFDPVIDNALAAGNLIPEPLHTRAETRKALGDKRKPLPEAIQKQFPSSFVFNEEMGWIPEGWEVARFKEIVEKYIDNRGKTPPLSSEGIPLIEVKHIQDNAISPNLDTDKRVDKETYQTWFRAHVEPNDVVISTVGTIGRICLVPEGAMMAIAQNLLGLKFHEQKANQFYMYYQMKNRRFVHDVNARLVVTVQASIKRKDLETIDLLLPPFGVQHVFSEIAKPLINKQRSSQNMNLARLRDTLLPKLLSGQLRIPDAEKLVSDAL